MRFSTIERETSVQLRDRSLLLPRDPRVFFLRDGSNFPVACVASKYVAGEHPVVRFAVSCCNPLDRKVYSPEKARAIALGRLETPRRLAGEVPMDEHVKTSIMRAIAHGESGPNFYPKHVREAAALWLADRHLRAAETGNGQA